MKLLFAGDAVIQNADNFSLSSELSDFIKNHDYSIINFEGSLKGASPFPIKKIGPNVYNCNESISVLKDNGFNIFTLANNHIVDFGTGSCNETLEKSRSAGIKTVGAGSSFEDCYQPLIIEKDDEKIAIINCCHAEFGVYKDKNIPLDAGYAWINSSVIDEKIAECKKDGCFVIVIAHAGVEFIPLPFPEWRERYKTFIDKGADLIIGGHPHTIQGQETYKEKKIFYSLGNFYFINENKKSDFDWNHGLLVSFDTKTFESKLFFTEIKDNQVCLCHDNAAQNNFEKRSNLLKDDSIYYPKINEIITDLWNKIYKPLYEDVPNFINARNHFIKNLFKYFAKKFIFKSKFQKDLNETLLLHNIQIESHRYVAERYLYIQNIKLNRLGK